MKVYRFNSEKISATRNKKSLFELLKSSKIRLAIILTIVLVLITFISRVSNIDQDEAVESKKPDLNSDVKVVSLLVPEKV